MVQRLDHKRAETIEKERFIFKGDIVNDGTRSAQVVTSEVQIK